MAPTPTALPPALPSELLDYVLAQSTHPTTLIICQPRGMFLSSLLRAVKHTSQAATSPTLDPDPESNDPREIPPDSEPTHQHPLLVPTLHQVATSRLMNLVFIPTVTHLRAYLAVFPGPESKNAPPVQQWKKLGDKKPLLVIYGVVGLHRDTSEWSAQGLGNSLAACVEAGWRSGGRVVVVEERKVKDEDEVEIGIERLGDEQEVERVREKGCEVWEERVPMLNGSVKRAGLESEEGGWSGRTVEVGRILARWFKFRKGGWESEDAA
jgi:hypothetical protein